MRTVVVAGSAQGPVGLLDAALGEYLRPQLRAAGTAFLAVSACGRAGRDPRAALADERAVVTARSGGCPTTMVTVARRATDPAEQALDRVAAVLDAGPAAMLLVVERQDACAEHAIADALFDEDPAPPGELVDHGATARALSSDPRVASVTVRPYELVGAGVETWVDTVLDLVGLQGRLDLRPLVPAGLVAHHGAISPTGLRLGRALGPELPSETERDRLRDFFAESFAASGALLDDHTRAGLVARHRDANRALFREFAADLPADSYATDQATAALAARLPRVRIAPPAPHLAARQRVGAARRALLRRVRRTA